MQTQKAFRSSGRKNSEDTGERRKKRKLPLPSNGNVKEDETDRPEAGPSGLANLMQNDNEGKRKAKSKANGDVGKPQIMPHESLGDYNRRVETLYRPEVSKAIKSASASRKAQAEALKGKGKQKEETLEGRGQEEVGLDGTRMDDTGRKRKAEFDPVPTPRRLNDIVQAPPNLAFTKSKSKTSSSAHSRGITERGNGGKRAMGETEETSRGRLKRTKSGEEGEVSSVWEPRGKGKSVLSAAQERILQEEREKVIKRYRELKAAREADRAAYTNRSSG